MQFQKIEDSIFWGFLKNEEFGNLIYIITFKEIVMKNYLNMSKNY